MWWMGGCVWSCLLEPTQGPLGCGELEHRCFMDRSRSEHPVQFFIELHRDKGVNRHTESEVKYKSLSGFSNHLFVWQLCHVTVIFYKGWLTDVLCTEGEHLLSRENRFSGITQLHIIFSICSISHSLFVLWMTSSVGTLTCYEDAFLGVGG